ncbi:hypothetical protein AB2B38_002105 [Balneola sp. MJW-20]|uniref:hypothetical protein n=1 Tax=Gracilimonas aurantiaca TaxID=3234185 RepID=UPI00346540DF
MKIIYYSLFLLLIIFVQACSPTQQTTQSVQESDSTSNNFPSWYNSNGVNADSLSFMAAATTISGDSLNASLTAEKEARMLLEKFIGDKVENIRMELILEGDRSMEEESFIFALRNAHQRIEELSVLDQVAVRKEEEGYRGFAMAVIDRNRIVTILDESLNEFSGQLNKIKEAAGFSEIAIL